MGRFTHSVSTPQQTVTANTVSNFDLPVNPLSHLLIHLRCLNLTANTKATIANLLATIDRLEVLYQNNPVIDLSGTDLHALTLAILGRTTLQENVTNLENAVRTFTLVVPFGRKLYNPAECFPATQRGNLILRIDWAASFTNLDGLTVEIEAVELPGAAPTRFLRAAQLTATPAATGDFDLTLPIGADLAAILLFGTTIPTGTTDTKTINTVTLLQENESIFFHDVNWEVLHAQMGMWTNADHHYDDHIHLETATDTEGAEQDDGFLSTYALMNFDPGRDDQFLLDTSGMGDLKIRFNIGVASEAIRVIPIQLMATAGK